jgi:hypothetical protein
LLAHGRWFSLGIPASSTTKTCCHDIAEILLKVTLKHQKSKSNQQREAYCFFLNFYWASTWPDLFFIFSSRLLIFVMLVHYLKTMCYIPSWPTYDLDLWAQCRIQLFVKYACLNQNLFFIYSARLMIFDLWTNHLKMMYCIPLGPFYYLDLWP